MCDFASWTSWHSVRVSAHVSLRAAIQSNVCHLCFSSSNCRANSVAGIYEVGPEKFFVTISHFYMPLLELVKCPLSPWPSDPLVVRPAWNSCVRLQSALSQWICVICSDGVRKEWPLFVFDILGEGFDMFALGVIWVWFVFSSVCILEDSCVGVGTVYKRCRHS